MEKLKISIITVVKNGMPYLSEAISSFDSYPVSKHHVLIFPKRHVKDYFELNDDEVLACNNLIKLLKDLN